MTQIAVILSGCGYLDGAEIREAVISLLALDRAGAEVQCFAPDIDQHHVVNHLTGEEVNETRNVLVEAARIARGNIQDLSTLDASQFDGLVIPGGFGVAKNLSDLAFKGPDATVLPAFKEAITAFVRAGKPVGAICITPAVLVAAIGKEHHPTVTIGEDEGTAQAIEAMGGSHTPCASQNMVFDAKNNIVSCSAYMREDAIAPIAEGIEKTVQQVVELSRSKAKAA